VARLRRILLATLAICVLAGVVIACSSTKKAAPPVSTSTTADTLPLDATPSSATDVYDGSEPRRQLRFHPAVGATFQTTVSYIEHTTYQVSYVSGGPVAVPPITAQVGVTVDAIDPDGTIRSTYRFSSVAIDTSGADPRTAAQAQAVFGSLNGAGGTIAMRPTGMVTSFTTDPPPGLEPLAAIWLARLSNSVQQLIVSFPTEPVGEGAVWKMPLSVDFDGVKSSITYSVSLTRLTTDKISLELTTAQTAPLGPVPAAGVPDGVTAELLAFHIDGAGEQVTDLAQILPASASHKASGDILFRLLQGATDERLDQRIAIELAAAAG
jgi:hypothetical protein